MNPDPPNYVWTGPNSPVSLGEKLAELVTRLESCPTTPPDIPSDTEQFRYRHDVSKGPLGGDSVSFAVYDTLRELFGSLSQATCLQETHSNVTLHSDARPYPSWPVPITHSLSHPKSNIPDILTANHVPADRERLSASTAILYAVSSEGRHGTTLSLSGREESANHWYIELLHGVTGTLYLHAVTFSQSEPETSSIIFTGPIHESTPRVWYEIGQVAGQELRSRD